jgi:hypothetical protein
VQRTGLTLKKAMVLGSLDRGEEANAVLEHLIDRCREDEQPDVRRMVAIARELLDED